MQNYRTHLFVFFVAVAALGAAALLLAARPGYGQSPDSQNLSTAAPQAAEPSLQPTALVRERRAESAPASDFARNFAEAATRNSLLRYELTWAFGGKQQRGWHLYTPLISRLVGAEVEATTNDFASALSRWQTTTGLKPSGVLDDETLYQMVAAWQGARLKDKSYPTPDRLLLAPASDFYDPSRPEQLRQVERETYAAYKRMVAAALADPSLGLKGTMEGGLAPEEKYLKIVSSFRSREYQEHLRRQSPHSGRAGLAVHSPHFTGRALDIYVGGEPVETKDSNRALQVQTRVYQWLVRNADRFGFRPYYYEPWHWEYTGESTAGNK
ncbi:MAG TPA: D-alanyl-D-alanine carboxypeptidase family protein [Pyrinomonadaceae bacterium]|nr:D-alanyl-D-alanine carboxypeptidase family protein [Pyrinomonadaceae bacterium]